MPFVDITRSLQCFPNQGTLPMDVSADMAFRDPEIGEALEQSGALFRIRAAP